MVQLFCRIFLVFVIIGMTVSKVHAAPDQQETQRDLTFAIKHGLYCDLSDEIVQELIKDAKTRGANPNVGVLALESYENSYKDVYSYLIQQSEQALEWEEDPNSQRSGSRCDWRARAELYYRFMVGEGDEPPHAAHYLGLVAASNSDEPSPSTVSVADQFARMLGEATSAPTADGETEPVWKQYEQIAYGDPGNFDWMAE